MTKNHLTFNGQTLHSKSSVKVFESNDSKGTSVPHFSWLLRHGYIKYQHKLRNGFGTYWYLSEIVGINLAPATHNAKKWLPFCAVTGMLLVANAEGYSEPVDALKAAIGVLSKYTDAQLIAIISNRRYEFASNLNIRPFENFSYGIL